MEQIYQVSEKDQIFPEDLRSKDINYEGDWWLGKALDGLEWNKILFFFSMLVKPSAAWSRSLLTTITGQYFGTKTKVIPLKVNPFKDGKRLLLLTPDGYDESSCRFVRGWYLREGVVRNTAGASYVALELVEKVSLKHVVYVYSA